MNPEGRLMKQVMVEDAEKADKLFDTLMAMPWSRAKYSFKRMLRP